MRDLTRGTSFARAAWPERPGAEMGSGKQEVAL
jgi:hypothetical protein